MTADFSTVAGRVRYVLDRIAADGGTLTVGAIYSVARDVICERVGMCSGASHPYSGEPAGVLRVEIRDGTSPGEALLYVVDERGIRVMRFGVMANRDFEAKEAIQEVLAAFASQTAQVAA